MILELIYLLTGTGLAFLFTGILLLALNKSATVTLVLAGLLLLTTGLVIAGEGVDIQTGEPCIDMTSEESYYWNCSMATQNCTGTPEENSCLPYDVQQCQDIPNCTWQAHCSGTPSWTCEELYIYGGEEKCEETIGCSCDCMFIDAECDSINTTYYYKNCSYPYTNYTGNPTNPTNEIDALYYLYILGGLFLILWGLSTQLPKESS